MNDRLYAVYVDVCLQSSWASLSDSGSYSGDLEGRGDVDAS